jgi:uncharacterized protein YutE (UPF0331/DUF86 family)
MSARNRTAESILEFLIDRAAEIGQFDDIEDNLMELRQTVRKEFSEYLYSTGEQLTEEQSAFLSSIAEIRDVFILHALNIKSSAIIELHSILESYMRDKANKRPRGNLVDFAKIFQEADILGEEDIKLCRELSKLRNGLAHKNADLVADIINPGKPIEKDQIMWELEKHDCTRHIIGALHILVKLKREELTNE